MLKDYGKLVPAVIAVAILIINNYWRIDLGPVSGDIVVIATSVIGVFGVSNEISFT